MWTVKQSKTELSIAVGNCFVSSCTVRQCVKYEGYEQIKRQVFSVMTHFDSANCNNQATDCSLPMKIESEFLWLVVE